MLTPNYARIEQGRLNITLDTIVRVADALGVQIGELFAAPQIESAGRGRPKGSATAARRKSR
jgi:transcriptional regulator with XRE-family HTH domain